MGKDKHIGPVRRILRKISTERELGKNAAAGMRDNREGVVEDRELLRVEDKVKQTRILTIR